MRVPALYGDVDLAAARRLHAPTRYLKASRHAPCRAIADLRVSRVERAALRRSHLDNLPARERVAPAREPLACSLLSRRGYFARSSDYAAATS